MDLIGFGADKQAVVIDIGSMYTKVGFAGEYSPRHIIRSQITEHNTGVLTTITLLDIQNYDVEVSKVDCEKKLTDFTERNFNGEEEKLKKEKKFKFFKDFFQMLYFKYLLVNPKERRVVISESMLKSVDMRNIVAEVWRLHIFCITSLVVLSLSTGGFIGVFCSVFPNCSLG